MIQAVSGGRGRTEGHDEGQNDWDASEGRDPLAAGTGAWAGAEAGCCEEKSPELLNLTFA